MAGSGGPRLLDADALIDEIIAKKGPQKYTEGLSEDKWEEVRYQLNNYCGIMCVDPLPKTLYLRPSGLSQTLYLWLIITLCPV